MPGGVLGPPLCVEDTIATLGAVTINDVFLHIEGAWNVLDPQQLLTPTAVKGENRNKPRARGRRANRWRGDQSEYSLHMMIDGRYDVGLAAVATNAWIGLQHNIEYLRDFVVEPPLTETVPVTYEAVDGTIYEGEGQPRTFIHEGTGVDVWAAVLTLWVPGGMLVPAGS
jgi:hypothetical protein